MVGDVAGNSARLREGMAAAVAGGATVFVAPELALCGYPPRDLLQRGGFVAACRRAAEELAAATAGTGLIAVYGAPWPTGPEPDGPLWNAAVVAHEGRVVAVVPKLLLPAYDVFDEPRHFVPGPGPRLVSVGGLALGVTICEDLWNLPGFLPPRRYEIDVVGLLAGADLVVNLSASPFAARRQDTRRRLVAAQARRVRAPVAYVNQVGGNDELLFDGGSMLVRADGELIHEAGAFVEEAPVPALGDTPRPPPARSWGGEIEAGLVRGIRDYAARCGFRRALLGLSGGVDSAVVAALAVRALGAENVWGVGLPGPYSSPGSVEDARILAANLGIRFDLVSITEPWRAVLAGLAPLLPEPAPAGDTTTENLQSRLRGVALMALSNRHGHLLLTTGNKSEVAVGYCTLYGDMDGGLNPVGDLYKTEIYRLARHLNRAGPCIPEATLTKPPSAELRPDQTDQDSLPPYEVLDPVLRGLVEEEVGIPELVARGFEEALVRRVAGLVRGAEFKRWQAPPILRVSGRAFGMGRRVPLAQRWRDG